MSVEIDEHEKRRELRSYVVGSATAVGVTAAAFLVVMAGMASSKA